MGIQNTDNSHYNSVPINVIKELPGTLGTALETSSHSSLNFNAQMDHRYQQHRERHGIAPKSPGYDSDSGSSTASSEGDLYGEDITLSGTKIS